LTELLEK